MQTTPHVSIADMVARRHGQEEALAPSGNVAKCFCALLVTAKCLLDELLMHYFESQTVVGFWGFYP